MKQNSKCKKIITIFLVIIVFSVAFIGNLNNVYAKVNTLYGDDDFVASQIDVDKAVSDSVIIEAIGYLVYAVAGFVEKIVTWMMGIFSGVEIFPWADKVVFNTVTFLDVNFLNPEPGSLFRNPNGSNTIFGTVIQNIYYTIFTLTIAFFGVVVGIMALRLAISSIASEKAKYKEAITNWLLALILVFTVHYIMSFVFWINEKMVEIATSVALDSIEGNEINTSISIDSLTNQEASIISWYALYSAYEMGIGTEEQYIGLTMNYGGDVALGAKFELFDSGNDKFSVNSAIYFKDYEGNDELTPGSGYHFPIPSSTSFKSVFYRKFAELLMNPNYMNRYGHTVDYGALANDLEEAADDIFDGGGALNTLEACVDYLFSTFSTTGQVIGDIFSDDIEDDIKGVIEDAMVLTLLDNSVINWINQNTEAKIDVTDKDYVFNHIRCSWEIMSPTSLMIMGGKFLKDGEEVDIDPREISLRHLYSEEKFYEDNPQLKGSYHVDIFDRVEGKAWDVIYDRYDWWYLDGYYEDIMNEFHFSSTTSGTEEIFTGLGEFFKNMVYGVARDKDGKIVGYTESEFNVIAAILYAMFVFQSLMYFVAYFKRFFYIVVLALFAPLVVVYDFLNKSVG